MKAPMEDIREAFARRLASTDKSNFLAALLRLARANDVSPAERDQMLPVLEWLKPDDSQLTSAMQRADDEDVSLAELAKPFEADPDRYILFRECCSVAWVSGRVTEEEEALLDRLALLLRLDERPRMLLDSPLACSPEGERRFLELLEGLSDKQ